MTILPNLTKTRLLPDNIELAQASAAAVEKPGIQDVDLPKIMPSKVAVEVIWTTGRHHRLPCVADFLHRRYERGQNGCHHPRGRHPSQAVTVI